MVFDILSFVAGVAAGGITGALAGILHGLESTADLHEKVSGVTKELEKMRSGLTSNNPAVGAEDAKLKMDALYKDLDEIQEEIRRMYKKTTR